ncbi:MAG: glycoside hydrolase family 2 protein [Actinobacteria bacterium]|nr:MAG: glycoside hydrolase family 2 protein [Actinomycetota bacterium]
MSADAPSMTRTVERTTLTDGWSAIAVSPGSTDHLLAGLDDEMQTFRAPATAGSALRDADLWRVGSGRDLDAEDWWFRCRFDAPVAESGVETVLHLEGLATVADVWLNGEHVLASDNMHVAHELPAEAVRAGENELVIGIRALRPLLQERRPRPRWRTRLVESQNLRWYRTALVGRLPAFAPEPAPVGPWRPVVLERRRVVVTEDRHVRASLEGEDGIVHIRAVLRPLALEPGRVVVRVDGPSGTHEAPLELAREHGRLVASGSLRIEDVALWWPHTHGAPALHRVELVVEADDRSAVIDAGRVGFRALAFSDDPGLSVTVNGVRVFCRGGSLIPDAVTLDHPAETLRVLLERSRDAGLNMIRLSGVGTYGSDSFFDLCDELGLLVWQDFAFANLDYPIDDEVFRASVELEARQFLARTGARPSLAVLCGNSEIEQQVGMLGLDPALGRGELFAELLPQLVAEHEVDAHYVPSTPSGGALPFRPNAGVAHYFGVGAYRRPLEDARRAEVRFATECLAIANVPDDDAIEQLAPGGAARHVHHPAWKRGVPRDVGTGWDFDDVRDHYLHELYGLDPLDLRWADPERYLAVSRVVSGEVMAATFGEWRRARSTCGGALVWTLNDPIPGAGWGILDVHGRPKAAYWYLRRALAPVAVWMTDEGNNGLSIHVANDRAATLSAELGVTFHRADGTPVETASTTLELAPGTTCELSAEGLLGYFADASYAYRFGPPPHEVVVATLTEDGAFRSQAFHFPLGPPAHVQPTDDIGLTAVATPNAAGGYVLELTSRRVAYAVSLDAPGLDPTDDFFTVAPGSSRTVELIPAGETPVEPRSARPLNGYTPVRIELQGKGVRD